MRSLLAAAVPLVLLAGCVSPRPAPPPAAPTPRAPPAPAAPAVAIGSDWRDWPLTPGTWTYRPTALGRSAAVFGTGAAVPVEIVCDLRERRITLSVAGPPGAQPITVRTSSVSRALPTIVTVRADAAAAATREVRLNPADPILDAMGFSRGRFVIEQAGTRPLVIPAWAEILRVVEDCRG